MNAFHLQHILSTFQHIDSELAQVEAVLAAVGQKSPLSEYMLDIGPKQRRVIEDFIARIRREMLTVMEELQIGSEGPRTSAQWALLTRLIGVSIAIAEMEPYHMGGYGAITPEDSARLARICGNLERMVSRLDAYIRQARGEDLSQRLLRLETMPGERDVLRLLEAMITRHGLLELRPALETITSRLESNDFEIAVFGRVSCGKSSLLNYMLQRTVLPVGVTPVTAVPTRLRAGPRDEMLVTFELSAAQRLPIDQIAQFVTEEGNPGNQRHVRGVDVFLSSPLLEEGIAFVDTPGVGSLATFGAAQTFAYLPRCDLGILLIDAGSTLSQEDLAIVRGLYDAATPTMILISKCDILSPSDRARLLEYVQRHLSDTIGPAAHVFPVSVIGQDAEFTQRWVQEQIRPLLKRHQELGGASIRRKIASLRETVAAALETRLGQDRGRVDGELAGRGEQLLQSAAREIARHVERTLNPCDGELSAEVERIIAGASHRLVADNLTTCDGHVLRDEVLASLASAAQATRGELLRLGTMLKQTGDTLASLVGGITGEDPDNPDSALAPLPAADDGAIMELPRVRLSYVLRWCPPLARWLTARMIKRRHRWAVYSLISNHRRRLRDWTRDNVKRIADRFDARAELVREALRNQRGTRRLDGPEPDALRADLELLRSEVRSRPPTSTLPQVQISC